MTKQELIKILEPFDDEIDILIDGAEIAVAYYIIDNSGMGLVTLDTDDVINESVFKIKPVRLQP